MATTITVPGGGVGTVSLTFATAASASLATNLLAAVYTASAAGTLFAMGSPSTTPGSGSVAEYIIAPTVTGAITVPAGYNFILDQATGPITVTGNSGTAETFVATSGASTAPGAGYFLFNLGSGIVWSGSGADTIQGTGSTSIAAGGDATYLTFVAGGSVGGGQTVVASGTTTTLTGTNTVVFGTGTNSSYTNTGGADTVVTGSGSSTVTASAPGGVYFDLAGQLLFIGSAASTVVAGSFAGTAFGGAGNSAYFLGSGGFAYVNGASNSSIVGGTGVTDAFNSSGGAISFFGASNGNALVAGAGAETLNAAFATGTGDVIYGGSGSDLALLGISGNDDYVAGTGTATILGSQNTTVQDAFVFVNGSAGGNDTIFNWSSSDLLVFLGYGAANDVAAVNNQQQITGGVQITLPDKTVITIAGISSISQSHVIGS